MKLYILIFLGITINFFCPNKNECEQKIFPLKSNRTDVEKLLGKPKEANCFECTYETPNEKIEVSYAIEKCKGSLSGWNVPTDVVLTVTVEPKKRQILTDAKLDLTGLISFGTDDGTGYYVDSKKGLMYTISPYNELIRITYLPLEENNKLRCQGFPPYNVAGA